MPQPQRRLVLVTGAARRIGAAIARSLHAAGWDLALHYHHSAQAMQALCAELEASRPGSTLAVQGDLADPAVPAALVQAVLDGRGRLDALVNNASLFHATPLEQTSAAQWDDFMAVNARAPFLLCQAAAPVLAEARGAIVNLADYYAVHPAANAVAYAASKAALVAVTRGLALALAPNVRVNAIAPGPICWPEGESGDADHAAILARTPLGRSGEPADIAAAVRWLLVDGGYVTGQVIGVDGGRSVG